MSLSRPKAAKTIPARYAWYKLIYRVGRNPKLKIIFVWKRTTNQAMRLLFYTNAIEDLNVYSTRLDTGYKPKANDMIYKHGFVGKLKKYKKHRCTI